MRICTARVPRISNSKIVDEHARRDDVDDVGDADVRRRSR